MLIKRNVGFLINKTGLKMKHLVQRVFAENGYPVTTEQWGLLQCLYERDGLSQVELSEILEKDKPNITRIIDVMERNNLVVRKTDPSDRRKFLIFLTSESSRMEKSIMEIAKKCREEIFSDISEKELEQLISVMEKINNNIDGVNKKI